MALKVKRIWQWYFLVKINFIQIECRQNAYIIKYSYYN